MEAKNLQKDIPIPITCKKCITYKFKFWIWHGIKIYQCLHCDEKYIEDELCKI